MCLFFPDDSTGFHVLVHRDLIRQDIRPCIRKRRDTLTGWMSDDYLKIISSKQLEKKGRSKLTQCYSITQRKTCRVKKSRFTQNRKMITRSSQCLVPLGLGSHGRICEQLESSFLCAQLLLPQLDCIATNKSAILLSSNIFSQVFRLTCSSSIWVTGRLTVDDMTEIEPIGFIGNPRDACFRLWHDFRESWECTYWLRTHRRADCKAVT